MGGRRLKRENRGKRYSLTSAEVSIVFDFHSNGDEMYLFLTATENIKALFKMYHSRPDSGL